MDFDGFFLTWFAGAAPEIFAHLESLPTLLSKGHGLIVGVPLGGTGRVQRTEQGGK